MVEVIAVTPEEVEMIKKARMEKARKAELDECFVTLGNTLARIKELGGSVRLPAIGGKYVSYHRPEVTAENVTYSRNKWGY